MKHFTLGLFFFAVLLALAAAWTKEGQLLVYCLREPLTDMIRIGNLTNH